MEKEPFWREFFIMQYNNSVSSFVRRVGAAAAFGALIAATPAAFADPSQDGYRLTVSGYVPVVCRANLDNSVAASSGNQVDLGTLHEFCNSANGYQVTVDHSPELAGATLMIDGTAVRLSDAGSTVISGAAQPGIAAHKVSLVTENGQANGTLSIRVTAL
ncbi:hypothetical protein [Sphingomonas sp. OTU376]|uniref:hypothetical protein n=1 Tax=Sphingomonas sp. OTU376 TaxID=3043863 RepID=UPI00313C279C